jgi:thiamine biosynthesis protein ThiS
MLTINNRDRIDWKEKMTVHDVLNIMGYDYALITVTVNGKLVPEEDYETLTIPDNAQVLLIHLAHGG